VPGYTLIISGLGRNEVIYKNMLLDIGSFTYEPKSMGNVIMYWFIATRQFDGYLLGGEAKCAV
jgi:hypothetical protein